MKEHWNVRYTENDAAYGRAPNVYFASVLKDLESKEGEKGRLLLPCDGEGRNAVHAAKQGWEVVSFDNSKVGVDKSLDWAEAAGVNITCTCEDAFGYKPVEKFDVIGLVFAHMPADTRHLFHQKVISWLTPGGVIILEGFHKDQLGNDSGGPRIPEMLFDEKVLKYDFKDLEIKKIKRVDSILNEGPFHQGPAVTIQMLANSSK